MPSEHASDHASNRSFGHSPIPEYYPTDWQTQIDPYPTYAWLRDHAPVYENEKMGFWALSRFEDVWDARLDHETFSSAWGQTLEKTLTPLPLMISMAPPKHTLVRQLVSKVFIPRGLDPDLSRTRPSP